MRGLVLTKSNSMLNEDPLVMSATEKPIDFSRVKNKEERELLELLQSLNENLEVLDGVREVFDRAADDDGTEEDLNLSN